jgi:hypothetical protein
LSYPAVGAPRPTRLAGPTRCTPKQNPSLTGRSGDGENRTHTGCLQGSLALQRTFVPIFRSGLGWIRTTDLLHVKETSWAVWTTRPFSPFEYPAQELNPVYNVRSVACVRHTRRAAARGQKSEVRGQRSEVRGQKLTQILLISDFSSLTSGIDRGGIRTHTHQALDLTAVPVCVLGRLLQSVATGRIELPCRSPARRSERRVFTSFTTWPLVGDEGLEPRVRCRASFTGWCRANSADHPTSSTGGSRTHTHQGLSLAAIPVRAPCRQAPHTGFEPVTFSVTGKRALLTAPMGLVIGSGGSRTHGRPLKRRMLCD